MAKYKHQYVSIYNEYNASRPPEELEKLVEKVAKEIVNLTGNLNLNPREVKQYTEDVLAAYFAESILGNGIKLYNEEKKIGVKK